MSEDYDGSIDLMDMALNALAVGDYEAATKLARAHNDRRNQMIEWKNRLGVRPWTFAELDLFKEEWTEDAMRRSLEGKG